MPGHKKSFKFIPVLLAFLGSMNLAIILLGTIAIASIIGTILQQNQAYQSYLIKFGPFWFELFAKLGLYDVYSSTWFLGILAFLLISICVCLVRNCPAMLREMKSWQDHIQMRALENMPYTRQLKLNSAPSAVIEKFCTCLSTNGYQFKVKKRDNNTLITAKRGMANRLGYVLTHAAIVVIFIGGALDSNIALKTKIATGRLEIETRDIAVTEVPANRWLGADNPSFRGHVLVPERSQTDLVFLSIKEGYVIQELPFSIELKDFRITHYKNGQPKSFESDLVIHDQQLDAPIEKTISVNHPLVYRGHTIYQASFQDGGSSLTLKAWPLAQNQEETQIFKTQVATTTPIAFANQNHRLEILDFRLFNIFPAHDPAKQFENIGPSFTYRWHDSIGRVFEYENYMLPVKRDGRFYFITGIRALSDNGFRYLYLPADKNHSPQTFISLLSLLANTKRMEPLIETAMSQDLNSKVDDPKTQALLIKSLADLVSQFVRHGYSGLIDNIKQHTPLASQNDMITTQFQIIRKMTAVAFKNLMVQEPTEEDWAFFDASLEAIDAGSNYLSPFYLQITDFTHRQASGLQIAKLPGKRWVYLGSAMLIAGVFMLFYIARCRLWLWLEVDPQQDTMTILFAGQSHRNSEQFSDEFKQLFKSIEQSVTHTNTEPIC